MANDNDSKKQLEALAAQLEAAKLENAKLQGKLEAQAELAARPQVLQSHADAKEAARAAERHARLHEMREEAKQVAGPGATHVKYIVGPSGTVRAGLGPVPPGRVIDVPVSELPANEWQVWKPHADAKPAKSTENSSAAEKALAQRAAMGQRASDRDV